MHVVWTFLNDIRYSVRLLRRSPWFSLAAVLTLSFGVGATTAIFTVFERIVLHPLPISEPAKVVSLHRTQGQTFSRTFTYPAFRRFVERTEPIFSSVAASGASGVRVRVGNETRLASAAFVSEGYFEQLGIHMTRGRLFAAEEYRAGAALAAIITDAFWRSRLAADPGAVGREIRLGDATAVVVGIAPRAFRGLEIGSPVDLFMPLLNANVILPEGNYFNETLIRIDGRGYSPQHWLDITARLKPGVSLPQAEAFLTGVTIDPAGRADAPIRLISTSDAALSPRTSQDTTRFATVLAIVVSLVLLVGCANLAGLVLARNEQRHREVSIRLALGAHPMRVFRMFFTESLLLSLLGGAGAVVIAIWMLHTISTFVLPGGIEMEDLQLATSRGLLSITAIATGVAAMLTGLLPAISGSRPDLLDGLKGRRAAALARRGITRGFLVAVQVAISLVLVFGAALFLRSLRSALATDVGTDVQRIAYAEVSLWGAGYDRARLTALTGSLTQRLESLPGVERVTFGGMPLVGFPGSTPAFEIDGVRRQLPQTLVFPAGPGYFEALGIELIAGRAFSSGNDATGRPVVVVNEAFARHAWPGSNPLGRRVFVRPQGPELEVIGVARDGKYGSLREAGRSAIYVPWHLQAYLRSSETIMLRTSGDPRAIVGAIEREIRRVDPALAIRSAGTLEDRIGELAMTQRIGASLLGWFSALALALALLGVFGLVAHTVAVRTTEIAIRLALGGAVSAVVRLMMLRALLPVAIGIVVGTAGAFLLSALARSFLFGVEPYDAASFAAAIGWLVLLVLLASYIPARRAAAVDPMTALRTM
jgi:predicted permease